MIKAAGSKTASVCVSLFLEGAAVRDGLSPVSLPAERRLGSASRVSFGSNGRHREASVVPEEATPGWSQPVNLGSQTDEKASKIDTWISAMTRTLRMAWLPKVFLGGAAIPAKADGVHE